MRANIVTVDCKIHYICRDSDFQNLLREYLGEDAAQYYEDRIKEIVEMIDALQFLTAEERYEYNAREVAWDS